MSDESSTEYERKSAKLEAKVAPPNIVAPAVTVAPGSGGRSGAIERAKKDFAEAGKNFYDGDVAHGVVNLASGFAELGTAGMSAAKDFMKESGKVAVIQTEKETAETAGKKAIKEVGEELEKQSAKGTKSSSAKEAAVESAKIAAKSGDNEATKRK